MSLNNMADLNYIRYDNKRLAVYGDKDKYNDIITNMGGIWNPRLKGGAGWSLDISKEEELRDIINTLNFIKTGNINDDDSEQEDEREDGETADATETSDSDEEAQKNRESERDEDSVDSENESESESEEEVKIIKKPSNNQVKDKKDKKEKMDKKEKKEKKRKDDNENDGSSVYSTPEVAKQYENFGVGTKKFKKIYKYKSNNDTSSSDSYSSSSEELSNSSSDDFPSPSTPKRRSADRTYTNYKNLAKIILKLEKRIEDLENQVSRMKKNSKK